MIDRIRQVVEYSQLSASSFADTIGISRSGLTHLLTGRNQPSLDVARKILAKYPEISTEWLIMGMGEMLRTDDSVPASDPIPAVETPVSAQPAEDSIKAMQTDLFGEYSIMDDSEEDIESSSTENEEEISEDEDVTGNPVREPVDSLSPSVPDTVVARDPEPPARVPVASPRSRKTSSESRPAPARRERPTAPASHERKLQKIVFFYDDHSFEVYSNL